MRKQMSFQVFQDPSHGWVKCPVKLLNELGITDKISHCSHRRGDFAYLEEDRDAQILFSELDRLDVVIKVKVNHANRSSKIRNYAFFTQLKLWGG